MCSLSADVDYVARTDYPLTFDKSHTVNIISISIVATDEGLPEDDEMFTVSLSFPGEPIHGVLLEPSYATVAIFEAIGQGNEILIPTYCY